MRAVEVAGVVDSERHLRVDEVLPVMSPCAVRVIVLVPEAEGVEELAWLRAAASNPAYDFLKEPSEDIYSPNDGDPFSDQR